MPDDASTVWFMGCFGQPGHFLWQGWDGGRLKLSQTSPPDFPWPQFDAQWGRPEVQGAATLSQKDGWTVLSVTDCSIDPRAGSHATFAVNAVRTFDEALADARRVFGDVLDRIGPVTEVSDHHSEHAHG